MYQSTPKNILLQNIKLKMYVVIRKRKNLKNYKDKNIKKYNFLNKILFYFDWKLCKNNIFKNINSFLNN